MANTLPNILIDDTRWYDLYALSGISVGTSIVVQNQSTFNFVKFAIAPTAPTTDDFGYLMPAFPDSLSTQVVDSGESGVFVMAIDGLASINVQRA